MKVRLIYKKHHTDRWRAGSHYSDFFSLILDMNVLSQKKKSADIDKTLVNDADMDEDDDQCNKLNESFEKKLLFLHGIEEVGEAHNNLFNSYHNH